MATAYGPPWTDGNGSGITATGLNLTAGPALLEVAVDPTVIALGSYVYVQPNPFDTAERVLCRRHRHGDPGPPRRHLRLARSHRPIGVGRPRGHRHPGPQPGGRQPARRGPGHHRRRPAARRRRARAGRSA